MLGELMNEKSLRSQRKLKQDFPPLFPKLQRIPSHWERNIRQAVKDSNFWSPPCQARQRFSYQNLFLNFVFYFFVFSLFHLFIFKLKDNQRIIAL